MSAKTYTVLNGAVPGAAAAATTATGTAIKSHICVATDTTRNPIRVIEWWTEFDGSAAATPIKVELIGHTTAAQNSLTAYNAADIAKANDPNAPATSIQLGAALSGWFSTGTEVTPTGTVRNLATHLVPPTSGIYIQYPLGREPEIPVAAFMRQRTTSAATVNMYAGISWEE